MSATSGHWYINHLHLPGAMVPVSDWDNDHDSIVGLWQIPARRICRRLCDTTWHADGTEIMFSGAQNPETGDVCQGVAQGRAFDPYAESHRPWAGSRRREARDAGLTRDGSGALPVMHQNPTAQPDCKS